MGTKKLTNTLLKSKLTDAMVDRGSLVSSVNLNDVSQPGSYLCVSPQGLPSSVYKYGILEVVSCAPRIIHRYYPDYAGSSTDKNPIYRMKTSSVSGWEPWRNMKNEVVS